MNVHFRERDEQRSNHGTSETVYSYVSNPVNTGLQQENESLRRRVAALENNTPEARARRAAAEKQAKQDALDRRFRRAQNRTKAAKAALNQINRGSILQRAQSEARSADKDAEAASRQLQKMKQRNESLRSQFQSRHRKANAQMDCVMQDINHVEHWVSDRVSTGNEEFSWSLFLPRMDAQVASIHRSRAEPAILDIDSDHAQALVDAAQKIEGRTVMSGTRVEKEMGRLLLDFGIGSEAVVAGGRMGDDPTKGWILTVKGLYCAEVGLGGRDTNFVLPLTSFATLIPTISVREGHGLELGLLYGLPLQECQDAVIGLLRLARDGVAAPREVSSYAINPSQTQQLLEKCSRLNSRSVQSGPAARQKFGALLQRLGVGSEPILVAGTHESGGGWALTVCALHCDCDVNWPGRLTKYTLPFNQIVDVKKRYGRGLTLGMLYGLPLTQNQDDVKAVLDRVGELL